jgi:3-hydroxymyristoyl/3-hydroxydecanoyl-(acyl carrier protein) dehydratase
MRCAEFSWVVPPDHPALPGHFPGRPIVPGVVLIDRAILFAERLLGCADVCWQIANAKFLSPVGPGETLAFRLEVGRGGAVSFSVRAGGRAVASGSLTPPPP